MLLWIDRADVRCVMVKASSSLGRASHRREKHQINPVILPCLNRFELGRNDRAEGCVEIPLVCSTVCGIIYGDITRSTMNSESTFTLQLCSLEFVKGLVSKCGQLLRFLMLVEKRALSMLLLTGSTRLPISSQARRRRSVLETS